MRRSASTLIISPVSFPMDSRHQQTKFSPRVHSSSSLLSLPFLHLGPRPSKPSPFASHCRLGCLSFTLFLLLTSVSLYLFLRSRGFQFSSNVHNPRATGYAIIIDAGSSGSRVHVYQYVSYGPLPLVTFSTEEWSLKTKPGLSSFADEPHNAGQSLMELLRFASTKVPERERSGAKIYLMATAGLRILDFDTQNRILESCRIVLRASGFRFRDEWASVITGTDEGIFAWIAANYALGNLGRNPEDTVGIIELGGASAQVTFVPDTPPPSEFFHTVELGGATYPLYTHSFLHFGQEAAWDGVMELLVSRKTEADHTLNRVVDPCTPRGFTMNTDGLAKMSTTTMNFNHGVVRSIHSTGNFTECRNVAKQLLQLGQDKCIYDRCAIGSTFVPRLRGKFFATQNFYYTSQFFGLMAKATLTDFQHAGTQFCEENWLKLEQKHEGVPKEDLLKYCFSSAYIVAFLHDSLGVSMNDDSVIFTNQIQRTPLDWALGAFIVKWREDGFSESSSDMMEGYKTVFLYVFMSLAVGVVVLIIYWWRRPHMKTIYDLEKGRYITTVTRNFSKF